MVGRSVAQYLLVEKLGAGGMGEIYKAHDTRLNRDVAIKVLPSAKSGDPDRRRRFLLEAQAASALNHPSIITIHDVISEGDAEFMVMELVSGKTLNDLIPKGGLRVPQALAYALQMADALSTAHGAGIVHRDLKPANVMVTDSGLIKVLDFGLAKLTERHPVPRAEKHSETDATETELTMEGAILGTVSYMSPEQAQGKKVDTRSDIFSFGAVFYEMLTGRHAFEGDTSLSTLSAILRDDVKPLREVAPDVPPQLDVVIHRCMQKNPDDRWQTMHEARMALSVLKRESESGFLYTSRIVPPAAAAPAATVEKRKRTGLVVAVAGILVVLAAAVAGFWFWSKTKPPAADQVKVAQETAPTQAAPPQTAPQKPAAEAVEETLSNDGVLKLVQEKVPVELILDHIRSAKTPVFDLSTSELIRLSKAGVPPAVIDQMRNPKTAALAKPPDSASAKPKPPQTTTVPVTDGTPFRIALAEAIPTDANIGRPLRFNLLDDFRVQGVLVVAKGVLVYGEITETPKKKFLGIGNGKLSFSLSKTHTTSGTLLSVRAVANVRDDGERQRPVDNGVKSGSKDIAAATGTEYIAYIDNTQNVTVPLK
jgi:serine/threonine-protein kinase